MTLGPGASVGPYRLERLLGRGGMAVVYEATHESIGRTVALKLLSPDLTDPDFVERFRDEGRMQAALDHPHAVTVYEAGASPYGPYLAMRLVIGTTLAGLIADGALSSARALDLIGQVAEALDAAHDAGLVHRDVKPRNVLVEGDQAYLADFGLTRSSDTQGITATGHFMGTIAYTAPEVVSGGAGGPAADRYALAAVLFECLTGTRLFPRPTHAAVLYAHTHEPPPRVSGRREGVPPALDDVLIAGLAKDPNARPARAGELVSRARAALSGVELGPPAPRVPSGADDATTAGQVTGPVSGAPVGRRRRDLRAIAAAAIAGAAIAGVAVALVDDGDGGGSARQAAPAPAQLSAAPAGTVRLGPVLSRDGRTVGCDGQAVTDSSPSCSAFQARLGDETTLVVPRKGVIRRWGVRSSVGEFALSVIRPDGDGYFQISRTPNEFVDTPGPHFFATDLQVDKGDRLALAVIEGSGVGVGDARGATTSRFEPVLRGLTQKATPGAAGELLFSADYLPGGRQARPQQIQGAAAATLPAGKTQLSRHVRFARAPYELRVVLVGNRGALDLIRDGTRVSRLFLPGMRGPLGFVKQIFAAVDSPKQAGAYIVWTRQDSDRLLHHYVVARARRLILV